MRAATLTVFLAATLLPVVAWSQPAVKPEARIDEPMTARDRVDWIVDGTVGPKSLFVVGVIGTAWQTAWNTPEEWGRSWSGAGKRYLQREADVADFEHDRGRPRRDLGRTRRLHPVS